MRMSITKKLIGGFLGLSLLVLIAGVVGIFVLNKVSSIADTVAEEKAPMRYAVMTAALDIEVMQKHIVEYNAAIFNLDDIGSKITAIMAEFDMWMAMLQHGTASDEFRNSPSQAIFQNKNLNITVLGSSTEMLPIVQAISAENIQLKAKTAELMAAKKTLNSYRVKVGAELLELPVFLNLAQLDNLDWIRQLKDAVNIETKFTANTDPTKGLIGEWLQSYKISNAEFMDTFGKFKEEYGKFMALADKINGLPIFKDKMRALNRGISITVKIESYFRDLDAHAKKMYTTLEANNELKQKELEASVISINSQLTNLVAIAEKEMRGAINEAATAKKSGTTVLIVLTVIAVIAAVVLGTLVSRAMSSKILSVAESTKNIAAGDLRKDLTVTSNDEIGDLARDTNVMITNLRQMIGKILAFATKLTASSVDLTGVSKDFDKDSTDLSAKSREASVATGNMNASMKEISTLANDSNHRVQNVAIATEEMSSTIAEIARNTEQAREVTSKAVLTVENTTAKMNELSNAANEIGKVAEVIVNIAKQTNLLSLNATIEAARAGDAGKGFAVVANEVKELASQTNKATGDIRQMIEAIQQSSTMTISEISKISNIINEINSIVVVIAGAVEEQAVTTKQITEDISSVSEGFEAMTMHVNSATEISGTVAADINHVSTTSLSVGQGSSYIHQSSVELGKLAEELNHLVGQFKL
ncbi:MAG: methyl-accepting chemotaxis protein [Proteobacteria bacterium]|nr:methyl-accepting chemotaxis protein [Pseudomonadota bacterium]